MAAIITHIIMHIIVIVIRINMHDISTPILIIIVLYIYPDYKKPDRKW